MSLTKPDLVLGYNHGYPWRKIAPFVNSLRATGFAGDIGLFTSGLGTAARTEIQAHGVMTLPAPSLELPQRKQRSRLWKFLRFAPAALRPSLVRHTAQLEVLRHFLYEQHLAQHGANYRRVLLTDLRDVVFQENPFAGGLAEGVHVFEEDAHHTIATRSCNANWVRRSFGPAALNQFGHLPILCSGVILGDAAGVTALLGHFCRTITRARSLKSTGIDQGIFNVAVRTWRHPQLQIHKNGATAVLTMGNMKADDISLDAAGRVTGTHGKVIPVLHQFDRHPQLYHQIKAVQEHAWPGAWRKLPESGSAELNPRA